MASQQGVLESLNVTAQQMSRGGSSGATGNSGGVLLAQLEDMNQRSANLSARAADIRSLLAFITLPLPSKNTWQRHHVYEYSVHLSGHCLSVRCPSTPYL